MEHEEDPQTMTVAKEHEVGKRNQVNKRQRSRTDRREGGW